MHLFTCSGFKLIFTPSSLNTSALPDFPDIALFPCFAIFIPAPDITYAHAVEILNQFRPLPPVQHVSSKLWLRSIFNDTDLIALAIPAISKAVSPLIFSAVIKDPNWAGVTLSLIHI